MGVRAGVVSALCDDGRRGVAGLASRRLDGAIAPLAWFLLQWLLNVLWTPLFFGLHRPGLALVEITLLWATLAATLFAFWRVKTAAGVLLVPYLAWVSLATALNFTIWRLNP